MSAPTKRGAVDVTDGHGRAMNRVGLTPRHALAARRHAERAESRGDYATATRSWVLASSIEPDVVAAWHGIARCLPKLNLGPQGDALLHVAAKVLGGVT